MASAYDVAVGELVRLALGAADERVRFDAVRHLLMVDEVGRPIFEAYTESGARREEASA